MSKHLGQQKKRRDDCSGGRVVNEDKGGAMTEYEYRLRQEAEEAAERMRRRTIRRKWMLDNLDMLVKVAVVVVMVKLLQALFGIRLGGVPL